MYGLPSRTAYAWWGVLGQYTDDIKLAGEGQEGQERGCWLQRSSTVWHWEVTARDQGHWWRDVGRVPSIIRSRVGVIITSCR